MRPPMTRPALPVLLGLVASLGLAPGAAAQSLGRTAALVTEQASPLLTASGTPVQDDDPV